MTAIPREFSGELSAESGGGSRRGERRVRQSAEAAPPCELSLQATASAVAPASPLTLTGTLSCSEGASVAGQTVTLYQRAAHTPGFDTLATATTEAEGSFQFALSGAEINSVFYVRCDGAKSVRTHVEAGGPQVIIEDPSSSTPLFVGPNMAAGNETGSDNTVTFTGTVTPAYPGAKVTLQREYRPGRWHRIGTGEVDEEGRFSITHAFRRPGEADIRVVAHFHRLYADSVSPAVTYDITHRRRSG
jgi:hypothetical protein